MTVTTIKIDEFSTGVKAGGNIEKWYSQGFTGEYMNRTIAEIPAAIQQAISNRLFALGEGGSSEEATLIGREIVDYEQNEAWSVLAVVTRGQDEWQRSFSAYRYLICDGEDNLPNLFKYWNENKLVFNPFDIKNVGDFVEYTVETSNISSKNLSEEHREFLQQKAPIIFPYDVVMPPLIIDCIATAKAEEDRDLVSWAYRVEALEHPRTFKAIFPASEQAEQILRRVVASQPQVDRFVQDEPAIKKAISLLSQNKVKPEHLKTIEDALGNPVIDDKYWRSMFDSQGASDAMKQGNYGHSMIRLLTLQAMVLPETFLPFLKWLIAKEKKTDHCEISGDFQSKIAKYDLSYCPKFSERIYKGVVLIIPEVVESPKLLNTLAWILKDRSGCWGAEYHKNVRQDIDKDLGDLKEYAKNKRYDKMYFTGYENWKYIYNDIVICWIYNRSSKSEKYEVLAELFERIGSYQASALFYHVAIGAVPPDIFSVLDGANRTGHHIKNKLYGLTIKKQLNLAEKFWYTDLKIGDKTMRLPYFTFIFIICSIFAWLGGYWSNKLVFSDAEKSINAVSKHLSNELNKGDSGQKDARKSLIAFFKSDQLADEKNSDLSDSLACIVDPQSTEKLCGVPKDRLAIAVNRFSETEQGIKAIQNNMSKLKNLSQGVNYTPIASIDYIADQLGIDSNQLQELKNADKKRIAYRIYKYQEKNKINPTGILDKKTQEQILKPIKPITTSN